MKETTLERLSMSDLASANTFIVTFRSLVAKLCLSQEEATRIFFEAHSERAFPVPYPAAL